MMGMHLIRFLTLIIFSQVTLAASPNSLDNQTHSVLSDIDQWNAQELKELLAIRIQDNQALLELIKQNKSKLGKTEIDNEYALFIDDLREDQKALLIITDHLSSIDKNKRLHLGFYFKKKPALKRKIQRILSKNLRSQTSQKVVTQVLYHTLMEKYAVR